METSRSAARKRRMEAKAKERIQKEVSKPFFCDDFTLRQIPNSCYMASATLAAARVFLRTHITKKEVFKYIRFSMANDQDNATGYKEHPSCPAIPEEIREGYALLDNFFRMNRHLYRNDGYPIVDAFAFESYLNQMVRSKEMGDESIYLNIDFKKNLIRGGGNSALFLLSILWAGGMENKVSICSHTECTFLKRKDLVSNWIHEKKGFCI